MNEEEIEILVLLFNDIMQHSKKIVLLGGDVSQQSLRLSLSDGSMLYVRSNNNERNTEINIINDPATWEAGLSKDIDELNRKDLNFRIRIVSQSPRQAMIINDDTIRRYPD